MKKVVFIGLIFFLLCGSVFGQTRSENRWLLGRWSGEFTTRSEDPMELTFNDNGTYRWDSEEGVFSINGNTVTFSPSPSFSRVYNWTFYRINDQRMLMVGANGTIVNFSKRS